MESGLLTFSLLWKWKVAVDMLEQMDGTGAACACVCACVFVCLCVCEDFSMCPYTVTTSTPAKSTLFSASACECPSTYSLYHHPEPAEPSSREEQGWPESCSPSHSLTTHFVICTRNETCEVTWKSVLGLKHYPDWPGWIGLSLAISPCGAQPSTAQWDRSAHCKTDWLVSSSLCNIYFQLFGLIAHALTCTLCPYLRVKGVKYLLARTIKLTTPDVVLFVSVLPLHKDWSLLSLIQCCQY